MSAASYESLRGVVPVSRETFEKLKVFETRFQHWNRSINLVASSQSDLWHRHIVDSAQLLGIERQATRWVDLGSGGGFPGLVVAFLLAERSGHIDLIESNRKKAAFLQAMVGEFRLPARVIARRITDSYALIEEGPKVVTARALAPLDRLLELSAPWLLSNSRALFHKGRDYRHEVEESAHRWTFDLIEHPSKTDPEGVVLDISNARLK